MPASYCPTLIGAVLVGAVAATHSALARSLRARSERSVGRYGHLDWMDTSTPESITVLGPVNLLLAVIFSGVSLLPVVGPLAGNTMLWGGVGLLVAVIAIESVRATRQQRG
ncbi:hypothetical protein ABXS69_07195 [Actinomyces timonensis]|uniref:Uncharacterized protein n=1 Tax=Actinomyces timonensis TaxID=1288391 RepID=A0AAU8N088_9ACTO